MDVRLQIAWNVLMMWMITDRQGEVWMSSILYTEGSTTALYIEKRTAELEADDENLMVMQGKPSLGCSVPTLPPNSMRHAGRGCRSGHAATKNAIGDLINQPKTWREGWTVAPITTGRPLCFENMAA